VSAKRSVVVRIRGREFRIRSDEDSEALERIARHVDETMLRVEERTGTVDSQDVALLTALNLAREVVEQRDTNVSSGADPKRLRALIELAESALSTEAG
jgi:cell division protein ZapA (FtsZ GTPase activity inhibitor)